VGLCALLVAAAPALTGAAAHAEGLRSWGVSMPGVPGDLNGLQALTEATGRAPAEVMWYAAWATVPDFPAADAARVAATGALPQVTWEPWDPSRGLRQSTYSLASIAAGKHDRYLARWADQVRAYGGPLVLRLAHEMNGSWYPWAEGVNGNKAGSYVKAWRHVHEVFAARGVHNVLWAWSPNVPYPGSTAFAGLYPGDAYVDRVALDGYNWADLQAGSTWQSFAEVFGAGITQLQALTSRPLFIGEVGCPEQGGDKAAWVRDMFATLAERPEIRGVVWFDHAKEADWRVDSSPASLAAFREGLASYS
jgi:beta-mannanase